MAAADFAQTQMRPLAVAVQAATPGMVEMGQAQALVLRALVVVAGAVGLVRQLVLAVAVAVASAYSGLVLPAR